MSKVFSEAIGRIIAHVEIVENQLVFTFADGEKLAMYDDGQSCCEVRYMRTDDDLADYAGSRLVGAEIKEAPDIDDEYGVHNVQFLEIQTDKGVFTLSNHNEHNGYYGGFDIAAKWITEEGE